MIVSIFPARGDLSLGGQVVCKVQLKAPNVPEILALDISLVVTNETEKAQRQRAEKQLVEEEAEFIVKDDGTLHVTVCKCIIPAYSLRN